MRRTILRSLLGPLVVTAALLIPAGTADNARQVHAAKAACDAKIAIRQARVASLERDAVRVDRGVVTKDGSRADRYVFASIESEPVAVKTTDGAITYELAHFGGGHATAEAESPTGYSAVTDRYYWYEAQPSILHWISDPCTGFDSFAYDFGAQCARSTSSLKTNPWPNDCNWNLDATLQFSDVNGPGGTWSNSWGGVHYDSNADPACASQGGQHALSDSAGSLRTWMRVQVDFLRDNGDYLFTSLARKTASFGMVTGGSHLTWTTSGTGEFIYPAADPDFAGNNPC